MPRRGERLQHPTPSSSLRLLPQPASSSLSLALSSSPSRFPSGFPEVPKSSGLGDPTWVLPPPCPPVLRLSRSTGCSAPHPPTPPTAAHPPCPTCPSHHQHPFTHHQRPPLASFSLLPGQQMSEDTARPGPLSSPSVRCPRRSQIKSTAFLQKRLCFS